MHTQSGIFLSCSGAPAITARSSFMFYRCDRGCADTGEICQNSGTDAAGSAMIAEGVLCPSTMFSTDGSGFAITYCRQWLNTSFHLPRLSPAVYRGGTDGAVITPRAAPWQLTKDTSRIRKYPIWAMNYSSITVAVVVVMRRRMSES